MQKTLYILLFIAINSCNLDNKKSSRKLNMDDNVLKTDSNTSLIVAAFNRDEKATLDSINKYGINDVFDSCLKYLYVLYGDEIIYDTILKQQFFIGELDIRPVAFDFDSGTHRFIWFSIFNKSSFPIDSQLNPNSRLIDGFCIDISKGQLLYASTGEYGITSKKDVLALYNSTLNSSRFMRYLKTNKGQLHPKFLRLIEK